jgi:hypothetical protein
VIGAQIVRSFLLGVIRFIRVPRTKNPTINQMAFEEKSKKGLKINPDLIRPMAPKNIKINS